MSDNDELENFQDSSEEEDDEELDRYEKDGFIVDDEEVEEEVGEPGPEQDQGAAVHQGSEEPQKHRKKRRKRKVALDEDDIALIAESRGEPGPQKSKKTSFKRLRKTTGLDADDAMAVEQSLFGSEDEAQGLLPEEDIHRRIEEEEFDSAEEDDLDGWMVEDVDDEGRLHSKEKRRRPSGFTSGVTQSQLEEANNIFGDIGDFLSATSAVDDDYEEGEEYYEGEDYRPRREKVSATEQMKLFKQQYEPVLLEGKHLTPEDERIRLTDIPERLQLRFPNLELPPVEREALSKEAEWIFARAFQNRPGIDAYQNPTIQKIISVLEFIRRDNQEVPFIAQYRKDYWQSPYISHADLWLIYNWDEKFINLMTRKANLRQMYLLVEGLEEEYMELLEQSETEQDVKDLYDHFQLHFSQAVEAASSSRYKRPVRRDYYNICKKAEIVEFANQHFGITAKQFGDNLMESFLTHAPTNPEREPESVAQDYLIENNNSEFVTVEAVLKAARYVLARELAFDPHVRQSLRNTYHEHAEVSTYPTPKGKKEVDWYHAYFNIKRLDRKPVSAFKNSDQFLMIHKAEKEGYIKVEFSIRGEADLLQEMEALYLSNGYSLNVQKWNEQRKLILRDALKNNLYLLFQNELRAKLLSEAQECVVSKCTESLRRMLMTAPYKPRSRRGRSDRDYDDEERDRAKVMACIWSPGNTATICVIIDTEGEPIEQLRLSFVNMRSDLGAPALDRSRKENDLKDLKEFIRDNMPDIIVLGAGAGEIDSRKFFEELKKTAQEVEDDKKLRIHVAYADSRISRMYKSSARAVKDFPDFNPVARQATSLARYVQDPLTEYAALCSGDKSEILCLRLHSLQHDVAKEVLLPALERVFIDVVNQVGVDINHIMLHKYASSTLQFVAGLGPRKAAALIQALDRKGGIVHSREAIDDALLTFTQMSNEQEETSCVYTNCVAFIRIRAKYFIERAERIPLDDTRVHPDDYGFARKMAADALEQDEDDADEQILRVIGRPKKLEDIDLETFAEEWERSGKGKKAIALQDIRKELCYPWREVRVSYTDLNPDELFYLLTGETEQTLKEGMLVIARVVRILPRDISCRLDNGLIGSIRIEDLTDQWSTIRSPDDVVSVGQHLDCRILAIDTLRFSVQLASSGSKLNDDTLARQAVQLDPYLLEKEAEETITEKERKDASQQSSKKKTAPTKRQVRKRQGKMVSHPLFKDLTFREAEELLRDVEPGEEGIVIRPSSKGLNHLTVTWKLFDNVCMHTDVEEKEGLNKKSRVYVVGSQKYEDLDEIIYRHVLPMVELGKEMLNYRYFSPSDKAQVEKTVRQEREASPNRIPYYFSIARDYHGKFLLSYMPGRNQVRHEYVTLTAEGFRFRGQYFQDVDGLVRWFKAHWKEAPPRSHRPGSSSASKDNGRSSSSSSDWGAAPSQRSDSWAVSDGWGSNSGRSDNWGRPAVPAAQGFPVAAAAVHLQHAALPSSISPHHHHHFARAAAVPAPALHHHHNPSRPASIHYSRMQQQQSEWE